ncbi:hypothetical protein [Paenibacillus sp. N3.4]|uniref:hypothetical protein n=1 Tax=Paenibacillus sp. N3.4 TaxID=2603222 RepID=UPI00164F09AE|nr:hypothetical protein [Paenibacillus sp. N3.4]
MMEMEVKIRNIIDNVVTHADFRRQGYGSSFEKGIGYCMGASLLQSHVAYRFERRGNAFIL